MRANFEDTYMDVYCLERNLIPDFEERIESEDWKFDDFYQRINFRPTPPPGTQIVDEAIKED